MLLLFYCCCFIFVFFPGSCKRWSGFPGQRPQLRLCDKAGDGGGHAHDCGRHGEHGPAFWQPRPREKKTPGPCPSSCPCCGRAANSPARSGCEEEETSSPHNPLLTGAGWVQLQSLGFKLLSHDFYTDTGSIPLYPLLLPPSVSSCLVQCLQAGRLRFNKLLRVEELSRAATIYLMMKHLNLQIYWNQ